MKAPATNLRFAGEVRHREFLGSITRYAIEVDGRKIQIDATFKAGDTFIEIGTPVAIDIPLAALIVVD